MFNSVASQSMPAPGVCNEKKKSPTYFFWLSFLNVFLQFLCYSWYQIELFVILSKAPEIQTLSQVSTLALGCHVGLQGALQEMGHVRIICSLHFWSQVEVIIGKTFSLLVVFVCVGFFCVAAFAKCHTDPCQGMPLSSSLLLHKRHVLCALLAVTWVS